MIRLFKHYIPYAVIFLAIIDLCLLVVAAETTWVVRAGQIGMEVHYIGNPMGQLLTFAASVHIASMAVGVYGSEALQWAQINYPYGAPTVDSWHKLEYDLYHAKNYTPFLNLLILLQTVRVVLWPEGVR